MPINNLSYNLKQLRHQKGFTQDDVAKQLDISIPAYSKIETGITDINLSRLEQLARLYNVTIANLLSIREEENSELIKQLKEQITKKDQEIINLQRQLIDLYKEIHP